MIIVKTAITNSKRCVLAISVTLIGCASADYGASSFLAQAPLTLRHKKLSEKTFFVESAGNGFASEEMLKRFFHERAKEVCPSGVRSSWPRLGRMFPDSKLDPMYVKADCGRQWCPRSAGFPLVNGEVVCE